MKKGEPVQAAEPEPTGGTRRLQLPVAPESANGRGRGAKPENAGQAGRRDLSGHANAGSPAGSSGSKAAAQALGVVLGILLAVVAAAIALGLLWFDIGGLKQQAARALKLDQASWVLLEERRAQVDKATAELAARQTQVEQDRQRNDAAAAALQKKEKDLDQRQSVFAEQVRQLSAQELSLQSLKAVYETMDPAKAAAMVAAAKDQKQVAVILKNLSQSRLSLILEQMPAAAAAELVARMAPDPTAAVAPSGSPLAVPSPGAKVQPAPSLTPRPTPTPAPAVTPKPTATPTPLPR